MLASASENKAKARSDREQYKQIKEEYEKTGDKSLLATLKVSHACKKNSLKNPNTLKRDLLKNNPLKSPITLKRDLQKITL